MSHVVVSISRDERVSSQERNKPMLSPAVMRLALILLLSTIFVASLMTGCRTADPTDPNNDNEQPLVRTTVVGTVVDESGLPVAGAAVSAHGKTATSDKNGYFVMQNVDAPKDRCVAMAKLDGYFTAAKADLTKENGLTQIKLFMMSHGARKNVNAGVGGTLTVTSQSGQASVSFDPDGLATASGASFSGNAQVAIRHLDPADPTFANYFAGDEAALRANGDRASLISYGVLRVDIRSANGDQLQPATGKPAVITYPIPSKMLATAPESMPLWFFDEQKGIWVEEGVATKQGSTYVGSVTHFTDWNADKPAESNADLTGLVHCNGVPMPGVYVRIGQTAAYTDAEGRFFRYVPAGIDLDVVVDPANNQGLYASAPMLVPMLSSREKRDISIALTSECPTTILGTLVDEQDRPIPGHVEWINSEGKVTSVSTGDGAFRFQVPSNSNLSLEATSWACVGSTTFSVSSGDAAKETNVGRLKVCSTSEPIAGDIDITNFNTPAYGTLSPDGSRVAINGYAPALAFRNTSDGTLISTASLGSGSYHYTLPPSFSADGSRLSIYDYYRASVFVFDVASGNKLFNLAVTSGMIMPDGNTVLVITNDSSQVPPHLARVSITTGLDVQAYAIQVDKLRTLQISGISSDGNRAILMDESNVIVYDLVNDVEISRSLLTGFSLSGSGLASVSADGSVMTLSAYVANRLFSAVINTQTGALIRELPPLGGYTHAVVTPDGTSAVIQDSLNDGTVLTPKIVSISDGSVIRTLTVEGDPGRFSFFSFSADGKRLAGVYLKDGKTFIRFWDL